jgi:hypothetical protein
MFVESAKKRAIALFSTAFHANFILPKHRRNNSPLASFTQPVPDRQCKAPAEKVGE